MRRRVDQGAAHGFVSTASATVLPRHTGVSLMTVANLKPLHFVVLIRTFAQTSMLTITTYAAIVTGKNAHARGRVTFTRVVLITMLPAIRKLSNFRLTAKSCSVRKIKTSRTDSPEEIMGIQFMRRREEVTVIHT